MFESIFVIYRLQPFHSCPGDGPERKHSTLLSCQRGSHLSWQRGFCRSTAPLISANEGGEVTSFWSSVTWRRYIIYSSWIIFAVCNRRSWRSCRLAKLYLQHRNMTRMYFQARGNDRHTSENTAITTSDLRRTFREMHFYSFWLSIYLQKKKKKGGEISDTWLNRTLVLTDVRWYQMLNKLCKYYW